MPGAAARFESLPKTAPAFRTMKPVPGLNARYENKHSMARALMVPVSMALQEGVIFIIPTAVFHGIAGCVAIRSSAYHWASVGFGAILLQGFINLHSPPYFITI